MQELTKIYDDLGNEFIHDLLNRYVVVTEKLSGSSFCFQKTGNTFKFFKGNSNKEINLVDRTLMIYYEKAIKYIKDNVSSLDLPSDWIFCFQYFVHNEPGVISYDKLPKNNLVLTHIKVTNKSGKTAKIISDPRVIGDWAKKLKVSSIQPIFAGKLNKEQKNKISEFISIPVEDQEEVFGTSSFASYIIKILNPTLKSTTLQNDLHSPIDSIVFEFFKPGDKESFTAKLIDPYTKNLMKETSPEDLRRTPADINEIVLLDILSYIEHRGLQEGELLMSTPEERYIELISSIFNDYVNDRGNSVQGIEFEMGDFIKGDEFDLNMDMIHNQKTKELLNSKDSLKDLYKVMLGSLRKRRNPNKTGNVLTKEVIVDFNTLIDKIKSITEVKEEDMNFKTYNDYIKQKGINESIYVDEDLEDLTNEEKILNFNDFVSLNKVNVNELSEALTIPHKEQGLKPVNIFVGRFQPFTLGHVKVFEKMHKENGLPVVVFLVRGGKPDPEKRPFDEDLQQQMFAKMMKQYKYLEAVYVIPNAAIDKIFATLRPTYEPVLWGFGTDRKKAYGYQIDNDKYRKELNVRPDFKGYEIFRTDDNISASKVRAAIKRDDEAAFKKMTPKSIHSFYKAFQNILEPVYENSLKLDTNTFDPIQEAAMKVKIDNEVVGTIDSNDTEAINTIKRLAQSSENKEEVKAFLTTIGVPSKNQKGLIDLFASGDWGKSTAYLLDRSLDVNSVIGKKLSAFDINEKLFGIKNKKDSLDLFSYQWPTQPPMGKGEVWLSLIFKGGSKAGVGDVDVNGMNMEVKGKGARLVGQKGYGDAKRMPFHFKDAVEKIARDLGATEFSIKDGSGLEWSVTKTSGRLLESNLKQIATLIGGFDKKQISMISKEIINAYKNLYVGLNVSQYGKSLEGAINKDGSFNIDVYNKEMLKMSFDYYHQVEQFVYFTMTNDKTGNILVIKPEQFSKYVDDGTVKYTPQSWGKSSGTQGGYFAIAIDKMS